MSSKSRETTIALTMTLMFLTLSCAPWSDGKLKDWGTKAVDGGIRLNVRTKWRDGKLFYLASMSPADSVRAFFGHRVVSPPAKPHPGELVPYALAVLLEDGDGFEIDSIPVRLPDLTEEWARKSYTLRGSTPLAIDEYRSIRAWNALITMGWSRMSSKIR